MGPTVYQTGEAPREGTHVYAHSRKDGKDGIVYLIAWMTLLSFYFYNNSYIFYLNHMGKDHLDTIYLS